MSPRERSSGSSLIEVLVATAILTIVMVGILQTFSLALVQNFGSVGRTQLMFKCQQTAEIIRISQYLGNQGAPGYATAAGIPYPLVPSGGPVPAAYQALPYVTGDPNYAFWGPAGANIVEKTNDAYRLFYTVEVPGGGPPFNAPFSVRVSAYPADSPNLPGTAVAPGARYMGKGSKLKVVEYVVQIPAK